MGDAKKGEDKDAFQKFSDGIRYAPNTIFAFGGDDKAKYV